MATRVNLAPNPACKVNATGWTAVDNSGNTLSDWVRSTSVGGSLPRSTGFEGTNPGDVWCPRAAVSAGSQYYWAVSVRATGNDLSANMLVNYYAALSGGSFVGNSGTTVPLNLSSGSTSRFVLGPYTAPAGAVSGYLKLNDLDDGCEVTAYQVELASTYGAYFDGDTAGASWDGASGNSTSSIRQILDTVTVTDSFGKVATAIGPTFADSATVSTSFSIAAGTPSGGANELAQVRDGFLIVSLEWDEQRGRNRVNAFTFTPDVSSVLVSRQAPQLGGAWQLVRGGTVNVSGGFMVRPVDDYEFPAGVDLDYRIEGVNGNGTVVQSATIRRQPVADSVWLKFIAQPSLNQRLTFMGRSEVSRQARSAVFDVVGRADPVVVSDVHSSRKLTIRCKTETPAETATLDHALSQGLPCYLHVPETINTPSLYAVIGDYSSEAPAVKSLRSVFTISLVEVAAPSAVVVSPGSTWQQVLSDYATWDVLLAAAPTWLDTAD